MPNGFFVDKASFASDMMGDRKALTTGTKPVSVCVKDFRMSDDPSGAGAVNAGYFGFTDAIEKKIVANTAQHLKHDDCKTIKELYMTAKGKTAVICGAGRSIVEVKDMIPDIGTPEHEDIVVFAINVAGMALGPKKVDYLFALDYSSKGEWYPEELWAVPIVMSFNCPGHFADYFKTRHYFASPLPSDKAMREKYGWLDIGSIATYSCMHMAYKMGVKRIVFLGHEFAYTPDSDGTIWNHWNDKVTWEMCERFQIGFHPDIHGRPTPTDPQLQYNMRIVAASSYLCAAQGIEVINATDSGILGIHSIPDVAGDRRIEPFIHTGAASVMNMPIKATLERIQHERCKQDRIRADQPENLEWCQRLAGPADSRGNGHRRSLVARAGAGGKDQVS